MSDEQKFEEFKQRTVAHNEKVYGAGFRAKYGDKEVDEANAAVMNLTQEQYRERACPRRVRRERKSAPSTAGGSPSPESSMTRPSTGELQSCM